MRELVKKIHPLAGDGVLLLALLGTFVQMQGWQSVAEERIRTLEVAHAVSSQAVPKNTQDLAVLAARVESTERTQAELKNDIVTRMDRIDNKLDRLTETLRNGR